MVQAILLLVAYHILFYWRTYFNPFSLARSELLSTFFPSWMYQGDKKNDPYFWGNYHAHPVLSTYYPFKFSGLATFLQGRIDMAFKALLWINNMHRLFSCIGWFLLIYSWSNQYVALFGAITLNYSGYNIKQQPCILYTIAWFPWLLYGIAIHSTLLASLSFGMILLAGYYPIGIQVTIIAILSSFWWQTSPTWILMGGIIGLPQLIPFLKHLPKTIRTNKHDDIGTLPWWSIFNLIIPIRKNIANVGYWESSFYIGFIPIMLLPLSTSKVWILAIVAYLLMLGAFSKHLPRIPARFSFTLQFALGWMAVSGFNNCCIDSKLWLSLIALQAFDVYWHNSRLMITAPYSELPSKPSKAFNTPLTRFLEANLGKFRVSGLPYPLFTGHINRLRTLGYSGGMQTKAMAEFRNDTNPNGSGEHDWFKSNADSTKLDDYGVLYAFSRKKLNWRTTSIRNLYRNPRLD